MKRHLIMVLSVSTVFFTLGVSRAVNVNLTTDDALGTSSFNTVGHWDNSTVPSAGNDYFNNGRTLRTPADTNSHSFGGDSLTISGDGLDTVPENDTLMYKGGGNTAVITINNLIYDGGELRHASSLNDHCRLDGNQLTVTANGMSISQVQGPIHLMMPLAGSGPISLGGYSNSGGFPISIESASSTYTGSITLAQEAGQQVVMVLSTNANLNFVIGANGVNNSVSGTGSATFDGVFVFDLTGASTAIGASWTIADVSSQSFGASFSVDGFQGLGSLWFLDAGDAYYQFDTASGVLSVIEAPPSLIVGPTTPADGAVNVQGTPVVSQVIVDGISTLDTTSITLTLDGAAVPHALSQSGTTSTVSYAVFPPFESESVHTARVVFAAADATAYTNTWTFTVAQLVLGKLYNINIAGRTNAFTLVPDGTVLQAGSSGANYWNNFAEQTDNQWATSATSLICSNAYDGSTSIEFTWSGSTGHWNSASSASLVTPLNQGYWGVGGFDGAVQLSGLNPSVTYDVYVYFTWSWNTTEPVTYSITNGTSAVTNELQLLRQPSTATAYDDFVRAVPGSTSGNYVVFEEVTPGDDGEIHIRGVSVDGGFNAIQLLENFTGPAFAPTIDAVSVADDMVTIIWSSDSAGIYEIRRKTRLSEAEWNPVPEATGLSGGSGISTTFPVSGANTELFRVYGQ